VLYGGTAIALHQGHRESVDFDFFSNTSFEPDDLVARYGFLRGAEVLQYRLNTLTVITATAETAGVKLSFFGGLTLGRLAHPQRTPDGVMVVASPDDLFAHSLKTIMQRVEIKDYVDVDSLIQSGLQLPTGLAGAQLLFPAFAPQECLKALTYFEDPALRDLPAHIEERLLAAVENVRSIPDISLASTSLQS